MEVKRHGPTRAVAGFETDDARPDTDFKLFYSTDAGDGSDIRINRLCFHDDGGYFLLLASPGEHINYEQIVRMDVVFVLDTTGSMAGLLEGAKQKIWSVANRLADGKPKPEIRMGVLAYRDRGTRLG